MRQINGWWLPDDDNHFVEYTRDGLYQQPVFAQAMQLTPGRTWALDVGAHVGFWSRILATGFARVDAFEPVPANLECLRRNVPENVIVHGFGLGTATAPLRLRTDDISNSGTWQSDQGFDDGTIIAEQQALDDYRLWIRGRIDVIKIDVQGMESAVLAGAQETILQTRPVVIIEMEHCHRFNAEALDWLHNFGMIRIGAYKADWIFGWPRA